MATTKPMSPRSRPRALKGMLNNPKIGIQQNRKATNPKMRETIPKLELRFGIATLTEGNP